MVTIRHYRKDDWSMIKKWWDQSGEIPPLETMMPIESSFIAEIDGEPALAVAIYLTNTPELVYLENFIGNPKLKGPLRHAAARDLSEHVALFAKNRGFKRLICMSEKQSLQQRYVALGFHPTLGGVTAFAREI